MAQRLRRPRWTDARLLVGAALVLSATLTGASLLGQGEGPRHWVAARDLPTGHQLTLEDLEPVSGDSPEDVYLTGDSPLPPSGQRTLLQPIRAGEYVATADLGARDEVDLRQVSLEIAPGGAAVLSPGTRVDLWATRAPAEKDARPDPEQVLRAAEVVQVHQPDARLAGGQQTVAVDLLVRPSQVVGVLAATAGDVTLTAVPVTGVPGDGEES
ncbi:SAF domain-containing protein [Kytococcus sp. Marseille-QA3725]